MVFHIIFIISMFEEIKNKKNMEIKMGGKLKKYYYYFTEHEMTYLSSLDLPSRLAEVGPRVVVSLGPGNF